MIDQLLSIEQTYLELKSQMLDEATFSDQKKVREVNKKMSDLEDAYHIAIAYRQAIGEQQEANDILAAESDQDFVALAKEQLFSAQETIAALEEQFKIAMLPKDPNDDKNIFLEMRPAAGGDEAGLFASELLKCYMLYAQKQWRRIEIMDEQLTDIGGVKNVTLKMSGDKVYSKMKRESGVHRVQRIPATESQGRVHTSTITVAIMPEVEDVDVKINEADVEIDTYAASSSWWQNANKNQTGVRLRHKPSGLIVTIGDSKSQLQNKEKARSVLRSRLYQIEMDKQQAELTSARLDQMWSGDRSEKIRTYNYPQDRITDHRIKESRSNLPVVMQWNIDDLINAVNIANQTALLAASTGIKS